MNSWSPVDYLFYLSFVFFAFGISLFFKKGLIATKFLGIQFIGLAYQLYAGYFIQPSRIYDYPHFFRTVSPFFYLLGPLGYLFQHYLLYPERKFRLIYLLHFLPFALHVIEYIPFYMLHAELKLEEVKHVFQQNTFYNSQSIYGWISMRDHLFVKTIYYLAYIFWTLYELYKFYKTTSQSFLRKNSLIVYWLSGDMVMKFVVIILHCFNLVFAKKKHLELTWMDYVFVLEYITMMLFMLFNPKLLQGPTLRGLVFQHSAGFNEKESIKTTKQVKAHQKSSRDKNVLFTLNRYFETEQLFLRPEITLAEVSRYLKIKPRIIRMALQMELELSFSDYVNTWRIQYAEEQCRENPKWKNYKLEVIAMESGFGTRQSFNSAVKKIKGVSPGKYFENIMQQPKK
ncbi:helix-turn-helix domain-containing protein [Aquirufa nivalisilvae]|uniref:helix-turn-helix domain-containing protein n=1 Tax=Aquirufa nivalisilvae TaxID=2516557 RepID=UPI0022A969DF|nr:helix-turn-helix domain-containing protein [Aquirufa nivalisilvae]MCZ2483876.1 helix-turn-helix domain-containing protein [Aquirufa nivalisilvae]